MMMQKYHMHLPGIILQMIGLIHARVCEGPYEQYAGPSSFALEYRPRAPSLSWEPVHVVNGSVVPVIIMREFYDPRPISVPCRANGTSGIPVCRRSGPAQELEARRELRNDRNCGAE